MSNFFGFVSDGNGVFKYIDSAQRKKFFAGEVIESPDFHYVILEHYGIQGYHSAYQYDFLTQKFTVDTDNLVDDQVEAEAWVRKLNPKEVCNELVVKPIINPFVDKKRRVCNKQDRSNLEKWISVWDSVYESVVVSIRESAGASARDSVRRSVLRSVEESIEESIEKFVWESVRRSAWASYSIVELAVQGGPWMSVWWSIREIVWAYVSSFFNLQKWKYVEHQLGVNPYQPYIDLWEAGLVPSFDGKTWRLHGHKGKIVYER